MTSTQKVLVTGASGLVGCMLTRFLVGRGDIVRALVRNGDTPLPAGVERTSGTLGDESALLRAVEGVNTVYHLAAKLHVVDPGPGDLEAFRSVNVEGTRLLCRAAKRAGVRRLVHFSTINVYGSTAAGMVADESSPTNPDSEYARSKLESERIALEECPSVVLRLAAVYGPRMKGNYPRLVEALRKGRFARIGSGENRRSLVHVSDVCEAALAVAQAPQAAGKIYNVTDGTIHTLNEVTQAICAALGRPVPQTSIPVGLAKFVAGLLGPLSPVQKSSIAKFCEDLAVRGDKLQQDCGYRPRVSLKDGWASTLRALEAAPS